MDAADYKFGEEDQKCHAIAVEVVREIAKLAPSLLDGATVMADNWDDRPRVTIEFESGKRFTYLPTPNRTPERFASIVIGSMS